MTFQKPLHNSIFLHCLQTKSCISYLTAYLPPCSQSPA